MKFLLPHLKVVSILCVVLLGLAFLTYSFISPQGIFSGLKNDLKAIDPGEEFAYTDLDGNPILLSDIKGKPLIINSWATWMPFSKDELALLSLVKKQHGDALEVLAINRMEDKELIKSYLGMYGIEQNIKMIVDPTDNFYKAIGGFAMPETVFYRDDGTIVFHKRGVLTQEELTQYTDAILQK